MQHLRIAVCDDTERDRKETLAMLMRYLESRDVMVRVDEYASGEEIVAAAQPYDLVLLDVLMGEMNGIDAARRLLERAPGTQIIFCSTSNQFAAESYDVEALRYLVKPIAEDKLFHTLDKYFRVYTALKTLTYKQNRMEESVYLSDVLWIEAGDHRSIIHTRTGEISTTTLFKQFCSRLENEDFVQPIRYALVSLRAVDAIPTSVLSLSNGEQIPISRELRGEIKARFAEYKMKELLEKGGIL